MSKNYKHEYSKLRWKEEELLDLYEDLPRNDPESFTILYQVGKIRLELRKLKKEMEDES